MPVSAHSEHRVIRIRNGRVATSDPRGRPLPLRRLAAAQQCVVLIALALLGCAAPRSAIGTESPAFEPGVVAQGAELAAIGNCATCHTRPDGPSYAGGRALRTPFGTLHSTNITPDPETGLGRWSEAEFDRAMREGIRPDGEHLYPAFPYEHFTRLVPADMHALYAFVMTREPVHAVAPPNRLLFPYSVRPLIGMWKALYFAPAAFVPDGARDAQWNRGAYLVTGLGHCGACHTPRNALGAEEQQRPLAGGDAEGWLAPALDASSPAPVPWTTDALVAYLRTGRDEAHGVAAGSMAEVTENLSRVPEHEVRAIAAYLRSVQPPDSAESQARAAAARSFAATAEPGAVMPPGDPGSGAIGTGNAAAGAAIFAGACATCHRAGGGLRGDRPVELALTTSVNAPDPRNAIRIVLTGLWPTSGEKGAQMPGFANELTDAQIIAVVEYLRARFSRQPPWPDVADQLQRARRADDK